MVQDPKVGPVFAGTVPPTSERVVPFREIELLVQVVEALAGLAKYTPFGRVLVNAAGTAESVSGKEFGLVMEIVKTDVPPAAIVFGAN